MEVLLEGCSRDVQTKAESRGISDHLLFGRIVIDVRKRRREVAGELVLFRRAGIANPDSMKYRFPLARIYSFHIFEFMGSEGQNAQTAFYALELLKIPDS